MPLEADAMDADRKWMLYTEKNERYLDENGKTLCEHVRSDSYQRYEAMLFAFAEMVRGERENPYTLDYELTLFRTLLRCCRIGF